MKATEYKINKKSDAEKFDQFLGQYRANNNICAWQFISLTETFEILEGNQEKGRIFSALFDICLQDVALQQDLGIVRNETNREYRGESCDLEDYFPNRINRYIAASNSVLRIRAMWDKILGLMVLICWPNKYQEFSDAGSKLKKFRRIAESWIVQNDDEDKEINNWNKSWEEEINATVEIIESISKNFRTAEAHNVGRIGKWAFVKT